MKQKVLKKLGLLALSGIMVVPNVLVETKAEAFPKLSAKDAGKNPTKQNNAKAIKGSGFFDNLFKTVGVLFALNETHNLIRNLIGNPWFCLGMARELFGQATSNSLTKSVLADCGSLSWLLTYFQRKTATNKQTNKEEVQNETEISPNNNQPKPVFQGILTPMSYNDANTLLTEGKKFAEKHPNLALLILKRFDAMLAMGIDIFRGVAPFNTASPNPNYPVTEETTFPPTEPIRIDPALDGYNEYYDDDFSENN